MGEECWERVCTLAAPDSFQGISGSCSPPCQRRRPRQEDEHNAAHRGRFCSRMAAAHWPSTLRPRAGSATARARVWEQVDRSTDGLLSASI